jgi:hypothetical protein
MAVRTSRRDAQPTQRELRRWDALVDEIRRAGFFRRGSLLRLYNQCGTPGCRCHADPLQRHGPYWQWTRKVHGKTVTARLAPEQAELLQTWLDTGRRLDQTLAELDALSIAITDRLLTARTRQ